MMAVLPAWKVISMVERLYDLRTSQEAACDRASTDTIIGWLLEASVSDVVVSPVSPDEIRELKTRSAA